MRKSLSLLAILLTTPVSAATADIDALVKCAVDPNDATRLACYDHAVAAVSADARKAEQQRAKAAAELAAAKAAADAQAAQAAAEAAKVQAAEAQRNAFGGGGVKSAPKTETVNSITENVTAASVNREGLWVVVLDNGQVWRQTDGIGLPNLTSGDTVTIRKGALGSYRLSTPRWKSQELKVKRIR